MQGRVTIYKTFAISSGTKEFYLMCLPIRGLTCSHRPISIKPFFIFSFHLTSLRYAIESSLWQLKPTKSGVSHMVEFISNQSLSNLSLSNPSFSNQSVSKLLPLQTSRCQISVCEIYTTTCSSFLKKASKTLITLHRWGHQSFILFTSVLTYHSILCAQH